MSPIKVHVKKFTEVLGSIQLQEKVLVSDTFNSLNLCTKMKDADVVVQFFIFGKMFSFYYSHICSDIHFVHGLLLFKPTGNI